jgi:cobalt-zinc-cadmium efflux system protein
MRSVLLDTVSDALTSAAVAVTGGIIFFAHGLYWLDPVVAIVISLVIGAGALRLLRDVLRDLPGGTPLEAAATERGET